MMRKILKEIISGGITGVAPGTLLNEVMKLMRERRYSCVPVLEDKKPVGIFTERRLVRLLAENGERFGDKPISEFMTAPVVTANQDLFIYEAFHLLDANRIRHLVIVDDSGSAVGVMTLSNLMDQIGEEFFVEFQPITRFMTMKVQTADPAEPLPEVLSRMAELDISCVVCARDNKPLGVITERDMVRLLEAEQDVGSMTVEQAMSAPALTIPPQTEIHEAARLMRKNAVRRLVVTDADGGIAGLATQTNIVRGLESKYVKVLKELLQDREHRLVTTSRERDELSLYLECIMDTSMDMGIVGSDTELNVIYCNEAASRLLDKPADETIGRKLTELSDHAGLTPESQDKILEMVRERGSYTYTYNLTRNDEEYYYQARISGVWDRGKNLVGYVFMVQDITERKKAEENIRYMAYHDILTGLPNRVAFDERLSLEMARAERNQLKLAIMVVDLDRFKEVNDNMGHFAGDLLLQEVSHRMQSCLRKSDTLARYGGDEFILVLPEIDGPEDARIIAEKLAEIMSIPVDLKGDRYTPTLSVGIAIYPRHAESRKKLIESADQAMYEAKQRGRDSGTSNYAFAGEEAAA